MFSIFVILFDNIHLSNILFIFILQVSSLYHIHYNSFSPFTWYSLCNICIIENCDIHYCIFVCWAMTSM